MNDDALQKLHVNPLADIGLGGAQRPPFLFQDLLLHQSLVMVSAEPFTGKTMLTLNMALCLDTGTPLFNKFSPGRKLRVLYIGQDAPLWDYAEQIRKLMRGMGLTHTQISILSGVGSFNKGHNILTASTHHWIQHYFEDIGFDVLFIDTLASIHSAEENSNSEMTVVMNTLKAFRDRYRCAVIFTHHDAKPAATDGRSNIYRPRGASVISGSVDAYISLRAMRDGGIKLSVPKGRGLKKRHDLIYDMFDTPDGTGIQLTLRDTTAQSAHLDAAILQACVEPKARHELISLVAPLLPTTLPSAVATLVDSILIKLQSLGKLRKVGRGTWQSIASISQP